MSRSISAEDVLLEKRLTPLGLALKRLLKRVWAFVSRKSEKRRGPDDDSQEAGVTARLKPPPPVLSASDAKALPYADAEEA